MIDLISDIKARLISNLPLPNGVGDCGQREQFHREWENLEKRIEQHYDLKKQGALKELLEIQKMNNADWEKQNTNLANQYSKIMNKIEKRIIKLKEDLKGAKVSGILDRDKDFYLRVKKAQREINNK